MSKDQDFYVHKFKHTLITDKGGCMFVEISYGDDFLFFQGDDKKLKERAFKELRIKEGSKGIHYIEVEGYLDISNGRELAERKIEDYQQILDENEDTHFCVDKERVAWIYDNR